MVVQWADRHADSKQLRLQDQLSIPWQRLMRYRLLLKGVVRHAEKPSNVASDRQIDQKSCVKQMVKCRRRTMLDALVHLCRLHSFLGLRF